MGIIVKTSFQDQIGDLGKLYVKKEFTGGSSDALDSIDGSVLKNGVFALVLKDGKAYSMEYVEGASGEEDPPNIVTPDSNPTGRWVLRGILYDTDASDSYVVSSASEPNVIPLTNNDGKLTVFVKDELRSSVEAATGGKVTVLYDDLGYPSYMVRIPKFKLEDIDPDLGSGVHPAFIVGDQEKSEIFIGQFQAIVQNNRAYSLPGVDPATEINYDQAKSYCEAKGSGWHLMTVHEWAAVMLWCLKNGFEPRGNTNWGRSHEATYETGTRVDGGIPGSSSGTGRTLTGSGPASWRHDNTFAGICDLVGNVWEWIYLFKLVDGRIYVPATNDFTLSEDNWTAQDAYFDSPTAGDGSGSSDLGEPILSDSITNYAGPTGDNSHYDYNYDSAWNTLNIKDSWDPPAILKQLCIAPKKYDGTSTSVLTVFQNVKGAIWVRNYGERFPRRGGVWGYGSDAGLAALYLSTSRSASGWNVGCRPAFIS